MRALVYGAVNPDIVHHVERLPRAGDDIRSTGWSTTWGGKAANAAMALAHWDVDVRLLGLPVGTDPLGDLLLEALEHPRLDRSWLTRTDEPTRHCVILVMPDGNRTIVCTGYEGARWQAVPEEAWREIDLVVLDGFAGDAAVRVAAGAVDRGIPVVWLDAPDPPPVAVDAVVWSSHEHTDAAAARVARSGTAVALTAGADPVTTWQGTERFDTSPPRIGAVDATGAGDVFAAGCAYGLAQGWPLQDTIVFAARAGAAAAERPRSELPDLAAIAELHAR